jgi:chromosome segregation ATPase
VGQHTANMLATADAMRDSATRTGASAQNAAQAAEMALANTHTVASAAEQLAASIREIGGPVSRSTTIVGDAVLAGEATRTIIRTLTEKVGRIGAVADMISEIAARTNLLALNATIEAARAGDAGKGFAVVASEVKQLAAQTTQATADIGRQIADVQAATEASATAVGRIEQTIEAINAITGSIAAAVEQQDAATAEISRSISETAVSATAMAGRISEVSGEAEETDRHAQDVRAGAVDLESAVADLGHAVIRVVRTSTADVDRSADQRQSTDLPCRIRIGGEWQDARLADLSETGACIRGCTKLAAGERGTLELDGIGRPLAFAVVHVESDALHVQFVADAIAAQAVRDFLGQRGSRQAA